MGTRLSINKKLWEELHGDAQFRPRYPHELVVQFVFKHFPRDRAGETAILDHGCGGGRHTIFLAENGYQAFGADISQAGLRSTKKSLEQRGLEASLSQIAEDEKLAYPDSYFDGIISFGVLYYLSSKQINLAVAELTRVLKPGGCLCAVVRSSKDHRLVASRPIGDGDYIIGAIDNGKDRIKSKNENGMLIHFFTKPEIKKRFKNFKNLSIDTMNITYDNRKFLDSDFIVNVRK